MYPFEEERTDRVEIFRSLGCLTLSQARHSQVIQFIEDKKIRKVLDLGTSQSTLLQKIQRGHQVAKLVGLEIQDQTLEKAKNNLMPEGLENDVQYLRHYNQSVKLYKGSALNKYPLLKSENFQLVTLVQVIEHIEAQYLPELNQNVFGYLRPKWVWLSTPNFEFNCLFQWQTGRQFRHDDHKFEWTRRQFQEYVDGVCQKYNYSANISGVGLAKNDEDLDKGFCTQFAVFERLGNEDQSWPKKQMKEEWEMKNEGLAPEVPLKLEMEHVNYCWKEKRAHLLKAAMRQFVMKCQSKGFLTWSQVYAWLRSKMIIKCLKMLNEVWTYDFHLKEFVKFYMTKHPEAQIVCSQEGLTCNKDSNEEKDKRDEECIMLDEEMESEMKKWRVSEDPEKNMEESDLKSEKSKKSLWSQSSRPSPLTLSSRKRNLGSEDSWMEEELVEENKSRRTIKGAFQRGRKRVKSTKTQTLDDDWNMLEQKEEPNQKQSRRNSE